MRIFERLRGRDRGESNVERKLLETVTGDLIRRIEDETENHCLAREQVDVLFLLLERREGASVIAPDQCSRGLRRQKKH